MIMRPGPHEREWLRRAEEAEVARVAAIHAAIYQHARAVQRDRRRAAGIHLAISVAALVWLWYHL